MEIYPQPASRPVPNQGPILSAASLRYQARIPKVGGQLLTPFQKDPQREAQLGITKYVVCRECGVKVRRLNGGPKSHLSAIHKLTPEQYGTRWPGAPVACADLRKNASKRASKQMESVRGRSRPKLKSVRGHTGEGALKPWPVICRIVQGHSYATLESEFRRDFGTIADCARKRGVSGKPCVYDFGEPFDKRAVRHLKKCTGLSAVQMANEIGLPKPTVAELLRPSLAWQRVHPHSAKKCIAWRDRVIEKLLATASKPDRVDDRYSGSRVLQTFFPDLRAKHDLLLNVLRKCRSFLLKEVSTGAHEMGEYFCAEAMLELCQGSRQKLFATFLPWAPDLMPFLQEHIGLIRGPGNLWPVAEEAIAQRWNTTRAVVNGARKSRARTIPPGEMRHLIQGIRVELVHTNAAASREGAELQRKRKAEKEKEYFQVGRKVEEAIPLFKTLFAAKQVLPESIRKKRSKLREELLNKGFSIRHVEAMLISRDPMIAARRFISIDQRRSFDVVAEYHRDYRRTLATLPLQP